MSLTRFLSRGAAAAALALGLMLVQAPPASAAEAPAQAAPVKKLDLNSATEAQLIDLPKIGPATAKAILEYRKQVGTFRTVDELVNVKGIGEKTLEILRPLVTVASSSGGKS